ncbi:MAG: hypothetical protein KF729_09560 [Sandaracinaceae bacterium]|nr:hypothetical protein [Sandaracinaceae bacterium]
MHSTPYRLRAALALAAALAACGSRTGLEVAPRDAAVDAAARPRFDAGTFTTFPCRWSAGLAAEVAPGEGWTALSGAVLPTADRAVVAATRADGARVAALVSIAAGGGVLAALDASRADGALFTDLEGLLLQPPGACELRGVDEALAPREAARWPGEGCALTQSSVGRIVSVARDGAVRVIERGVASEPVAALAGRFDDAEAFHDAASGVTIAVRREGASLALERYGGAGAPERHVLTTRAGRASAAADPLRGGILVHLLDAETPRLEHFDWEPGRWPEPHFDVAALRPLAGPIATNETEVLIPLADGRVAYVPFALVTLMVRWIEPLDAPPVGPARVILRPGGSAGGVLYAGGGALRFVPLVCNR